MSVGKRIKEERTKLSLTQKELSEKLNVTAQAVSRWENDDVEPSIDTLKTMSALFNITLDELLDNSKEIKEEIIDKDLIKENEENMEAIPPSYEKKEIINIAIVKAENKDTNKENTFIEQPTYMGPSMECVSCHKLFPANLLTTRSSHVGRSNITVGPFCKNCDSQYLLEKEKERKAIEKKEKAKVKFRRILGYILGLLAFGIFIGIGIWVSKENNNWTNLGVYSSIGIVSFTLIGSLLFGDTIVFSCLSAIAGFSIHLPGIIFELSIDGILFLIFVKVLGAILSLFVSVICFFFGLFISGLLSLIAYPYYLIKSYIHPEDMDLEW